jgi:hypothetical protein
MLVAYVPDLVILRQGGGGEEQIDRGNPLPFARCRSSQDPGALTNVPCEIHDRKAAQEINRFRVP